jgi:glycerol kinase
MMQIQSDILAIPINRPKITEVTALGAAIAAGIGSGVWKDLDEMQESLENHHEQDSFGPHITEEERIKMWESWEWGVQRSLGWVRNNNASGVKGN